MPSTSSDPTKQSRFGEKAKFLPVAFVVCNILGLYLIYMFYHAVPRLSNEGSRYRATIETAIFNAITVLLAWCYVSCIVVHPGSVPDKNEDASWQYVPQDTKGDPSSSLQETKRSGDRRHCKWCAKYKPDRCHHCRVCRMCILKMDHHCPWIYNCVGFRNHKYFFLLLFYATIDCHIITWTMLESVKESVNSETPFMTSFLLLFGETLAAFIGTLVTMFFGFHIWLMTKAMTTIEFCEKSLKRTGYDSSVYDQGLYGNIQRVLGDNPLLWLVPACTPTGRGLDFVQEAEDSDKKSIKEKSFRGYGATTGQASGNPTGTYSPVPSSRNDSGDEEAGEPEPEAPLREARPAVHG